MEHLTQDMAGILAIYAEKPGKYSANQLAYMLNSTRTKMLKALEQLRQRDILAMSGFSYYELADTKDAKNIIAYIKRGEHDTYSDGEK